MIKSMTGFGNAQIIDPLLGKANLEIRSLNHRFLELVFNLPLGFSYLEHELRREITRKVKRGRIIASLNITNRHFEKIVINKGVIKNYFQALNKLKAELALRDKVTLDMLMRLPGVVSVEETKDIKKKFQRRLKELLHITLNRLDASRKKAGKVLYFDLKARNEKLKERLRVIKKRAKFIIAQKASSIKNMEEKAGFLKDADITEELTLLKFHLNNFQTKLNKSIPVGKELDFIAQEMQREVNTLAAKSFDAQIVASVVEMKSQIEKAREQLQNVE